MALANFILANRLFASSFFTLGTSAGTSELSGDVIDTVSIVDLAKWSARGGEVAVESVDASSVVGAALFFNKARVLATAL